MRRKGRNSMDILQLLEMTLSATLRMSTPLLLASLASMFASRCGIMPLGVEGMITFGAFSSVVGSWITGNPWHTRSRGLAASSLLALLNAWLCICCHVNHIIGGLGLNMLVNCPGRDLPPDPVGIRDKLTAGSVCQRTGSAVPGRDPAGSVPSLTASSH